MNKITNNNRSDFFSKNKWNKRFRYLLSNELSLVFNKDIINDFCYNFQNTILPIALEYSNYEIILKYFWNTEHNLYLLNNILDLFILDEFERQKIFDISGDINIDVLNWKLKIKRYNNDDFVNIILENNKWISYDIINSYQWLGKTNDNNYCKKYLIYLFWIDRYYEDMNYWIMYEIRKIDDNNYTIRINDKEYIELLKSVTNQITPNFTNLPWDIQKNINFR